MIPDDLQGSVTNVQVTLETAELRAKKTALDMPEFAGGRQFYQAAIKSGEGIIHTRPDSHIDAGHLSRPFCGAKYRQSYSSTAINR